MKDVKDVASNFGREEGTENRGEEKSGRYFRLIIADAWNLVW